MVAAVLAACALGAVASLWLLVNGALINALLLAAITVFAVRTFWRTTRRKRELLGHGFFTGRRVGTHWMYEELQGSEIVSLELALDYVGRGEYDVHLPSERDWLATMPAWARDRRAEIVGRLERVFKRSQLHFDPDVAGESK
jgi:hypothetical protein